MLLDENAIQDLDATLDRIGVSRGVERFGIVGGSSVPRFKQDRPSLYIPTLNLDRDPDYQSGNLHAINLFSYKTFWYNIFRDHWYPSI